VVIFLVGITKLSSPKFITSFIISPHIFFSTSLSIPSSSSKSRTSHFLSVLTEPLASDSKAFQSSICDREELFSLAPNTMPRSSRFAAKETLSKEIEPEADSGLPSF
jgi:hypothetical protein